jgi:hypothetical protein|tara:strand:+ start:342 stop:626 length:285 start_codon:yes stop_codon:yes gene_type:complete
MIVTSANDGKLYVTAKTAAEAFQRLTGCEVDKIEKKGNDCLIKWKTFEIKAEIIKTTICFYSWRKSPTSNWTDMISFLWENKNELQHRNADLFI